MSFVSCIPSSFFGLGGRRRFFAFKCHFKTFEDKLFANIDNGLNTQTGQFVNLFVGPIGAIGICFEQDDGAFDFL